MEHWKEQAVGVSRDVQAKMLRAELAGELTNVLEPVLSPQLRQALADSLKWKSSEVLEKIRPASRGWREAEAQGAGVVPVFGGRWVEDYALGSRV